MKSNEEIIQATDFLYHYWEEVEPAMKEAQIEILKEVRNRKYDGRPIGVQGKTTDEIIEDLIKEIES